MVPGHLGEKLVLLELFKRQSLFGISEKLFDQVLHISAGSWLIRKGELCLRDRNNPYIIKRGHCILESNMDGLNTTLADFFIDDLYQIVMHVILHVVHVSTAKQRPFDQAMIYSIFMQSTNLITHDVAIHLAG